MIMSAYAQPLTMTRTAKPQALQQLRDLVEHDMQQVDNTIGAFIASHVDLISTLSLHTVSAGGKRLRPMLTLACAKLCDYEGNAHVALATAVEFIHTATLLHDDVVDASSLRRGKKTANYVWGNKESILVGDFLLGRAFYLMGEAKSLEIYRILSGAAVVISEGEVMQLVAEGDLSTSQARYLEIIGAKTAELFAAACEIGGILGNQLSDKVQALRDYGYHLGVAFQIIDDALDYSAKQAELGKEIGNDFQEAKMTLPVLLASQRANPEEQIFWQRTLVERVQNRGDLEHAIHYIEKTAALTDTMSLATFHIQQAESALHIFPDSPVRQVLLDILSFVTERSY